MRVLLSVSTLVLASATLAVAQRVAPALDIYHVDVEGGAATLIVTPARESLLVDAGWPGNDGRDVRRIQAAMKAAGISRIDHFITSHYHTDHVGGVAPLMAAVPIGTFHDHGTMTPPYEKDYAASYEAYTAAVKARSTLKPGTSLTLRAASGGAPVTLAFVAAHGTVTDAKGTPNPACASAPAKPDDPSDNARSVAFVLSYGAFDFFDAGDLTWNTEAKLACPDKKVPAVDVYQVTHHGLDTSNNPVLLQALAPTVAVMNNGPKKGGSAATVQALKALPTLQALYQLHRNVATGPADNTAPELTANLEETPDAGHMVSVHVQADGRYEVVNHRTGEKRGFSSKK
jgi:competence protein ComEC